MRKLLVLILFVYAGASAQSDVTTFILVRHAEKETGTGDVALSAAGQERAQALLKMFERQAIDGIFSTNYNRTKSTVTPLANAKNLTITTYESFKQPQLEPLITNGKGKTYLICGHSNTTPGIANLLLGSEQFKNYDDSDYGNILIVSVTAVGKGTVTHLRY